MTAEDFTSGAFYLRQVGFGDLPGVFDDNLPAFWKSYLASCKATVDDAQELRKATPPGAAQRAACARALALGPGATSLDIQAYLEKGFAPYLIVPNATEKRAFFTAYYRPEVRAS